MLGAQVFVLELPHLGLGSVQSLAEFSPQTWRSASVDACATGKLELELFFKFCRLDTEPFEQGAGKTFGLSKQSQQKVLVGNLGMIAF